MVVSQERRHAAAVKASKSASHGQFDPWILWVTVRRSWVWAVPVGLVLASIASYLVFRDFIPRYRASHLLEANEDYVVFQGVMPTISDIAATETSLVFNPIVIDPVLADAGLRQAPSLSDPTEAERNLRANLKVASGGARSRLMVSYEDTDRDAAAMVCNAIVDSYLRQRDVYDKGRVANLERWLQPEIQRWEQEVSQRQVRVQKLSEQTFGFSQGQRVDQLEDTTNMSMLSQLRAEISNMNVELAVEDAQRSMRAEGNSSSGEKVSNDLSLSPVVVQRNEPSESEIAEMVSNDAEVAEALRMVERYKSVILNLEDSDLVRIRREYYQETKSKRDQWLAKVESLKQSARGRGVVALKRQADEEVESQKFAAQSRLESRQIELERDRAASDIQWQRDRDAKLTRLSVLQKQYDEERARMEQFGGVSAELQFGQAELDIANDVLTKLRTRVAAIRTESHQDGSVRSLAAATPPKTPVEVIPVKKMMMASAGAFVIPFLIGLLWELRVKRLTDSSVVDQSFSLAPVMGEIAKLPSGARGGHGRRVFEESVDALRANLFMSTETKNTRSLAVVSSMSGEGKSSVASQLALSIAKASGKTVLLVDADLRYPDQHEIFGLQMGPGLSGFLSQGATLDQVIDTSLGDLLHVLPAGRLDRSPHRLISQSAMRDFVDQALERYSYVVIDTAPVLSASESLAVATAVDATLLCVMRDVSRMESVQRSMRRLEAAGANVAGTVFSGVTTMQYAYRYGNYQYAIAGEAKA